MSDNKKKIPMLVMEPEPLYHNKENDVKSNANEMTERRTGIGVDPISGDIYDGADGEEFLKTTTRRISDGDDVAEEDNEQPASAADQSDSQWTARAAKMLPCPVRILYCRTAGLPEFFCADRPLCRSSKDSQRQSRRTSSTREQPVLADFRVVG